MGAWNTSVTSRLITGVLAACLVFATGMRPCAAMMMAQLENAHDCCDEPDRHPGESKSDCELMCAIGGIPFTSPDSLSIPEDGLAATAESPADRGVAIAPAHAQWSRQVAYATDHGPPLFVLHAAFLI